MAGLREQWRRTAMRAIQECALDLFETRGFDAVTIEDIASAAEVSPSSVYRYFRTKEGILVADEFDVMTPDETAETIDPADPIGGLLTMVHRYETPSGGGDTPPAAWRRVAFFFTVPSVRAAMLAAARETSEQIAPVLVRDGRFSETQAHVLANALTYGYLAALELWWREGRVRPIAAYVEEGMQPLRSIWATERNR